MYCIEFIAEKGSNIKHCGVLNIDLSALHGPTPAEMEGGLRPFLLDCFSSMSEHLAELTQSDVERVLGHVLLTFWARMRGDIEDNCGDCASVHRLLDSDGDAEYPLCFVFTLEWTGETWMPRLHFEAWNLGRHYWEMVDPAAVSLVPAPVDTAEA